jgi:hypothetical protein
VHRSIHWLLLASSAALAGCSSPAPAETSLSLVSDAGLLDADVRVVTPVERGNNELFVQLRPRSSDGMAQLLAVDASMPAHGHEAHASNIDEAGTTFHASGLNLFMTGRWLVTLQLSLADEPDSVSLPLDVP